MDLAMLEKMLVGPVFPMAVCVALAIWHTRVVRAHGKAAESHKLEVAKVHADAREERAQLLAECRAERQAALGVITEALGAIREAMGRIRV